MANTTVQKSKGGTVSEKDYLSAVSASIPTEKQINEATARNVNPVTGTSLDTGKAAARTAIAPAQGTPVGMDTQAAKPSMSESEKALDTGIKGELSYTNWKKANPEGSFSQWKNTYQNPATQAYERQLAEENAKSSSGAPQATAPSEGETPEQAMQRQLSDAKAQSQYWQSQTQEKSVEQAKVSGQVAEFGAKLADFQAANADAIRTMNNYVAGLGDRVANVAAGIPGVSANIGSPQVQSKIQEAIQSTPSVREQDAKIRDILSMSGGHMPSPGYDRGETSPLPNQGSYVAGAIPRIPNPQAEVSDFHSSKKPDIYSLIDSLKSSGSDGSDFTSADYGLMALENAAFTNAQAKADLSKKYEERKARISSDQAKYEEQLASEHAQSNDFLESMKDEALRRTRAQEEQITAEKETKMSELSRKTERMESFIKAQMSLAGIPIEGQMGLSMLSGSLADWQDSVTATESQYNRSLADLHNSEIDIIMDYTGKVMAESKDYTGKLMASNEKYSERYDQIESDETLSENQYDMLTSQALGDFLKEQSASKAAMEKSAMEYAMDAQSEQRKARIDAYKSAGYVPTVGADGNVTFMVDDEGKPVRSMDSQKMYAEMGKSEIKTITDENGNQRIVLVNPYTGAQMDYGTTAPGGQEWTQDAIKSGQVDIGGETIALGSDWSSSGLPGSNAECVGFGRFCNPDLPYGLFSIADKRKVYSGFYDANLVQVGDGVSFNCGNRIGTMEDGSIMRTGHWATVTAVNGDGTIDVLEANYDNDPNRAIVGIRKNVPINTIDTDPSTGRVGIFRGNNPRITSQEQAKAETFDFAISSEINQYFQSGGKDFPYYAKTKGQKDSFRQMANEYKRELENADIGTVVRASIGNTSPTATMQQSTEKSFNVINNIQELHNSTTGEASGPILGYIRSNNPYDTKANLIKAQLTSLVPNLARGVYGEVGVLTDNDVKLYSKTLPNLESKEDLRDALLAFTLRVTKHSIEQKMRIAAGMGYDVSGMAPMLDQLDSQLAPLEQALGIGKQTQENTGSQKVVGPFGQEAMLGSDDTETFISESIRRGMVPMMDKDGIIYPIYPEDVDEAVASGERVLGGWKPKKTDLSIFGNSVTQMSYNR